MGIKPFYVSFQMGFAAAAPFVFKSLSCPIAGVTADLLRRNILSTKTVRRVYYTAGKTKFSKVIFEVNALYKC